MRIYRLYLFLTVFASVSLIRVINGGAAPLLQPWPTFRCIIVGQTSCQSADARFLPPSNCIVRLSIIFAGGERERERERERYRVTMMVRD